MVTGNSGAWDSQGSTQLLRQETVWEDPLKVWSPFGVVSRKVQNCNGQTR